MKTFIETKRLVITIPELSDFDNLYALQSDPEIMEYIGRGVRTKDEVLAGLEKAIHHFEKHGFSLGCVFEKESGKFVGRAGLLYLAFDDNQPDIEIGYALTKNAWNKGYATELGKALIQWGFQHLNVNKLTAIIKLKNDRSRHVIEKLDMYFAKITTYNEMEVARYEIEKPTINYQNIELIPASLKDYPIVQNMGRFYAYDMSEYLGKEKGWEMPEDGLYECIDFKKYWHTDDAFPFLIRYANELAGFVIVDKKGSSPEIDFNMAQFFILRKFKDQKIGKYVAHQCFDKFKGIWEIMVMPGNEGAYRFWRRTVKKYTNDFAEYTREIKHFNNTLKNIFRFDSR